MTRFFCEVLGCSSGETGALSPGESENGQRVSPPRVQAVSLVFLQKLVTGFNQPTDASTGSVLLLH